MKQRISVIVVLVLALLVAAACGGGGDGGSTNDPGTVPDSTTPGADVGNDQTNGSETRPDSPPPGTADANDNLGGGTTNPTPGDNTNDNLDGMTSPTPDNINDNLDGTASPAPDDNANDNQDQTQDPSQGEDDKGQAVGSADEGLDARGGGFEWQREGGIAGFCDVVTVLAGTATVASCASDPPRIVAELSLSAAQSRQVMTWIEDLRTFEREQSDGAVADSMSTRLVFEGEGDNEPTDEILADIEALVSELLAGASSP